MRVTCLLQTLLGEWDWNGECLPLLFLASDHGRGCESVVAVPFHLGSCQSNMQRIEDQEKKDQRGNEDRQVEKEEKAETAQLT